MPSVRADANKFRLSPFGNFRLPQARSLAKDQEHHTNQYNVRSAVHTRLITCILNNGKHVCKGEKGFGEPAELHSLFVLLPRVLLPWFRPCRIGGDECGTA